MKPFFLTYLYPYGFDPVGNGQISPDSDLIRVYFKSTLAKYFISKFPLKTAFANFC
jgi:hypothetical protein